MRRQEEIVMHAQIQIGCLLLEPSQIEVLTGHRGLKWGGYVLEVRFSTVLKIMHVCTYWMLAVFLAINGRGLSRLIIVLH